MKYIFKQCDKFEDWYWSLPIVFRLCVFFIMVIPSLAAIIITFKMKIWIELLLTMSGGQRIAIEAIFIVYSAFLWLLAYNKMVNHKDGG